MSPDQRIARLASRQYGVFSRVQAIKAGLSQDQIQYRLAVGRWARVHRRVYGIAGVPPSSDGDLFAALLAIGPPACASGCSAAALWGLLDRGHCADIHVSVSGRFQPRLQGVNIHRPRLLTKKDVTRIGALRVTTPTRTLMDLSGHLDVSDLEEVLDRSIRQRLVRPSILSRRITGERTPGRRGLAALESLLQDRDYPRASGSPAEALFQRLLRTAHLPQPEREFTICDVAGRFIARVDFAYVAQRLAIEIDGFEFHGARDEWERDHERRACLSDAGWTPLSFTVRAIRDRPDEVTRIVRRALHRQTRR